MIGASDTKQQTFVNNKAEEDREKDGSTSSSRVQY